MATLDSKINLNSPIGSDAPTKLPEAKSSSILSCLEARLALGSLGLSTINQSVRIGTYYLKSALGSSETVSKVGDFFQTASDTLFPYYYDQYMPFYYNRTMVQWPLSMFFQSFPFGGDYERPPTHSPLKFLAAETYLMAGAAIYAVNIFKILSKINKETSEASKKLVDSWESDGFSLTAFAELKKTFIHNLTNDPKSKAYTALFHSAFDGYYHHFLAVSPNKCNFVLKDNISEILKRALSPFHSLFPNMQYFLFRYWLAPAVLATSLLIAKSADGIFRSEFLGEKESASTEK